MTWHAAPGLAEIVWCRFPYVAVFGTSSVPAKIKPWQLLLAPGVAAFKDSGLTAATIFDFERRAVLPCDNRYFPDSPKIGILPKHYLGDAQSAMLAAVEQERLTQRSPYR